jgi:uncharacterized protein YebE (UPF0316 family)
LLEPSIILGAILIFAAKVIDVSIGSMRLIFLTRGKKYIVAGLGLVESIVYIVALGFVVNRLDNPLNIAMYGLGFAGGNIMGSIIEERMAVGYLTVQVISVLKAHELVQYLREMGYGVTCWEGEGREGPHSVLSCTLARKELSNFMEIVDEWDSHAFVTILDNRTTKGGVVFRVRQKQK